MLPRAAAAAELGLDPAATTVLVNLGQGAEVREANRVALAALAGRSGVQVAALSSALERADDVPEGVVALDATYPMSRYFAAVDACVAAAGYNAFHELIALAVPSLFVPMPRLTDDQPARARWAEDEGAGLAVAGPGDPALPAKIDELLERRDSIRAALAIRPEPRGAADAATWLTSRTAPTVLRGDASPSSRRGAGVPTAVGELLRLAAATAWRLGSSSSRSRERERSIYALEVDGDVVAAVRSSDRPGRRAARARPRRHRCARRPRRASARSGSASSTFRPGARARLSSPAAPTSRFALAALR